MITVSRTATVRLSVFGFIIVTGFGTLAWMASDTSPDPTILEPPWEQAPMAVTEAEIRAAQDLARYLRTLPGEGDQNGIRELEWTRGWYDRPISNLDLVGLRRLLVGNRFVFQTAILDPYSRTIDDRAALMHFSEDGILRTCKGGLWRRYHYHVVNDLVGAATYVTMDSDDGNEAPYGQDETEWWTSMLTPGNAWYGRPITFNALTGILAVHSEKPDGSWSQYIGHVQTVPFERPRNPCSEGQGAAKSLPATLGSDRAHRPVVPLFSQDPSKPLRMGVYFSLYPPPEEGRK